MLPTIKTIVYASDLGHHTRPAMNMAASIAKQHNAKIVYLHVLEPLADTARTLVSSYFSESEIDTKFAESAESTKEYMTSRIKEFYEEEFNGEDPNIDTEIKVITGQIEDVILSASNEVNADMIIMGSRTHSAVGRMMMGSSANKIVHTSKIPVLVVPIYG